MSFDPVAAAGYIGAAIACLAAAYERNRSQKATETAGISKAKDELAAILQLEIAAWKQRYETEHVEYNSYRERTHAHNNETNVKMLQLVQENTVLASKTDITPVLSFTKEQSEINLKVLEGLSKILERLGTP